MRPWDKYSITELPEIASSLIRETKNYPNVWLFRGEMGAGKTTLIKEICHQLGVAQSVQSPTFSLVNEYVDAKGQPVYHFDLYRLNSEEEGYDMGLDEYFYSDNWCFIEWPEKTPNLIPIDHASISIKVTADGKRELVLKN